jgi:hypothetical protein
MATSPEAAELVTDFWAAAYASIRIRSLPLRSGKRKDTVSLMRFTVPSVSTDITSG